MADEMVPIRSVKQYIREFIYEGMYKNHARAELVHDQLLDAFQKEIFGQLMFRFKDVDILSKPDEEVNEATREQIRHILDNANRKWRRLCIELSRFKETYALILPGELMERMKDVVHIQENDRNNPGEQPKPEEVVVTPG